MQITFNEIPLSNPDLNAPGRGAEQWHDRNDVNIPTEGQPVRPFDVYYRRAATAIEGKTQGSYNWAWLDGRFNDAISKKQTLSIGIMTVYPGGNTDTGLQAYDGGTGSYPEWLHRVMQNEGTKDWRTGSTWTPNYNSPAYLAWLLSLNQAVNNHIETTSFNGVKYKDAVGIIDIRGYGAWGEWHSGYTPNNVVSDYPSGTFPTLATLKQIVDAHTKAFPNIPLVNMIAAFDCNRLGNTKNPPEIAEYILKTKNNWGQVGWRRDQYGATDDYIGWYLEKNQFKDLIMSRWQTAPITGEPPAWNDGEYFDLERQVRLYHTTSFGNGNYGGLTTTSRTRVRAAAKICGYRFKVINAETNISGNNLEIKMNWQNVGNGNAYQNWDIVFELVGTSWKGVSKHKLKFFQPKGSPDLITETFAISGVNAGTYPLRFSIKDSNGYRVNIPLAIQGADGNNSYSLGSVQVGSTPPPPPNQGPIANAGVDKEITLPVSSVLLQGTGTDQDGTIQIMLWEKVSGSGTLDSSQGPWGNTNVKGLTAGTSIFKLTVTDDKGAKHSDTVNVKVNPADEEPPPPPPPPPPTGAKKIVDMVTSIKTTYRAIFDDGSVQEITK